MALFFIMTTHNRAEVTRRCLERVREACRSLDLEPNVVLVDAGSTDGTPEIVRETLPSATVLPVSRNVFWAEGMSIAESYVLNKLNPSDEDFIVWLNDDVVLDPDSLSRALGPKSGGDMPTQAILVGSMRDSDGQVTYGGLLRPRWNPLGIRPVHPQQVPARVDTLHGNFVIIPVFVAKLLGGIDGRFGHHMADIDYGLRARKKGVPVILLPGTFGLCEFGPAVKRTILQYWSFYFSIKGGGHWPTRVRFLLKHSTVFAIPTLLLMDLNHLMKWFMARH